MSYDIWLAADVGAEERARIDALDHWNYTSNVAPMWRKAMPDTNGLAGLHDMLASDAAKHLRTGIAAMEADPAAYREMEPENGWGNFDSQFDALRRLLAACEEAPGAYVEIWR